MQAKNFLASLCILMSVCTEIKGQCKKPTLMENAVINEFDAQIEVFDDLSIVRLECMPGYEPSSRSQRELTCDKKQWKPSPEKFTCRKKTCGRPGVFQNGHYELPDVIEFGATIRAVCKLGFSLRGKSTRMCLANGTLDGRDPVCVKIEITHPGQCFKPTPPKAAAIVRQDIMPDALNDSSTIRFQCHPGYEPTFGSPRTLTCKKGQWMPPLERFSCQKKSCGHPGDFMNGHYEFPEGVEFGAIIRAVCKPGYYMIGSNARSCMSNGEWAGREPVCEVVKCGPPPVIPNSQPPPKDGREEYSFGEAVQYTCEDGYTLLGDHEPVDTVYCLENGNWSKVPRCAVVNCKTPVVQNARRVEGQSGPYGHRSTLVYECNDGYKMNSSDTGRIICLEHGWSSTPKCEEVICPPLGDTNAIVFKRPHLPYRFGAVFGYKCEDGYKIDGRSELTCGPDGKWSSDPPICKDECRTPLGIESGNIVDAKLTASSTYCTITSCWYPHYARLNKLGSINAWSPAEVDQSQWLQVDLGRLKRVSGIITQGAKSGMRAYYVSAFKIKYHDGKSWKTLKNSGSDKIFEGNKDNNTPKKNMFDSPISAHFVRFLPWKWHNHIAVRMELLGCREE